MGCICSSQKGLCAQKNSAQLQGNQNTIYKRQGSRANPKKSYIIAVSDIHLGQNNLQTYKYKDQLMQIFQEAQKCEYFVLIGDIFDGWSFSMDATPRDFLAIASNYQFFVKSILSLSGIGVKVVYVKGNHDINITKNEIDIIFGEGVVDFYENEFSLAKGKIFFAHGHNYDLYNQRFPADQGVAPGSKVYPLGYYITRIATTYNNLNPVTTLAEKQLQSNKIVDLAAIDLYKFFKEGKNWTKDLLVAASNPSSSKKKNTWDDIKNLKVLMPPGDSAPSEKKLSEVLVQYDKTIDQWEEKLKRENLQGDTPQERLGKMIQATAGNLQYFAELKGDEGYKIVLFGHTHQYVLKRLQSSRNKSKLVYANTGGCCSCFTNEKKVSFAEIELNQSSAKVSVKHFHHDRIILADNPIEIDI